MFVKICGIKSIEDARMALEAGADAIGFLLGQKFTSGDFIEVDKAIEILRRIHALEQAIAVTHLNNENAIGEILEKTGIRWLQLHEPTDDRIIRSLRKQYKNLKIIRVVHVADHASVGVARSMANAADMILLDSRDTSKGKIGGTGKIHDWEISRKIVTALNIPVILAGGLQPGNVQEAIGKVRPFGVDANTGLQYPNTFKDPEQCKKFIKAAKLYKPK